MISVNRRLLVMLPMGFASGLPLALSGGTLQAWLTVDGMDIATIGIFSLVGLPYTLKFLWSPLLDRYVPPWLGRRRGWISFFQVALVLGTLGMGLAGTERPFTIGLIAFFLAFFSASQDIAVDAYRTDLLEARERGLGAAFFVTGYRMAMLVSGALALVLADLIGFASAYLLMGGLMGLMILGTFLGPEPAYQCAPPRDMGEAIWGPLKDFLPRQEALLFLALVVLYKLGDACAGTLTTSFLIRGAGFTPTDVGAVNKGLGLIATLAGAFLGGGIMTYLGLFRSLLLFGCLQAVSNLAFMAVAMTGKSYPLMVAAVGFENISGGMGTASFVALLMSLCNHRYSATQYALLSALSAMGRVLAGPPSGYLVEAVGWPLFFLATAFVALPGLLLLVRLRERIEAPSPGLCQPDAGG